MENNPEISVDADELVPQVNPAEIPSDPPEGITDPKAINQAAIDKGAHHVHVATLGAMGDAADNEHVRYLKRRLLDTVLLLHLEANPEWMALQTFHEKAVDAALRIRLGFIELVVKDVLLREHLLRLRGPGLSLN